MALIDTSILVGNVLGCYELGYNFNVTEDFMDGYAEGLASVLPDDVDVDFDRSELEDVCLSCEYARDCRWDDNKRTFRRTESGHVSLSCVNGRMYPWMAVVVEAYTRWFVARHFKKEGRDFMEYTQSMAQSACFAMDCIR
ncbi:MAG: hypothetical protein HDQ88_02380 [Clostridia bacterium]|nr:hypothetical protein [Clostridia bacterium]